MLHFLVKYSWYKNQKIYRIYFILLLLFLLPSTSRIVTFYSISCIFLLNYRDICIRLTVKMKIADKIGLNRIALSWWCEFRFLSAYSRKKYAWFLWRMTTIAWYVMNPLLINDAHRLDIFQKRKRIYARPTARFSFSNWIKKTYSAISLPPVILILFFCKFRHLTDANVNLTSDSCSDGLKNYKLIPNMIRQVTNLQRYFNLIYVLSVRKQSVSYFCLLLVCCQLIQFLFTNKNRDIVTYQS